MVKLQRLYYTAPNSGERAVARYRSLRRLERERDREIEWPGGAFRMNVAGFGEALEAAVEVETVRRRRSPRCAPFQLLRCSRSSRGETGTTAHARDATDLRFLMSRYADAGNYDRLYDGDALGPSRSPRISIRDVAGAALLARDMVASRRTSNPPADSGGVGTRRCLPAVA